MANYSTSANNNDSNAWKAFDNKADTNWTASYTTTGELVFNFGVPTTIKGVRFTPVSNKLTSFPKKAYLSGSSGSGSPTELQTFNLTEPTDDTPQSFKFDNTPVKYATYIFTFGDTFATSTGTKEVAIAEVEFLVSKGIVIPEPKLQEKTVMPTTSAQTVTADSEYDGLSKVTVEAISLQEKTATPAKTAQIITPDASYDGLSKVTVGAISLQEKTATPTTSEQIITPDVSHDGLSKVTVAAATLQTKTVTPTTSQQVITPDSSYYGLSKVTVNAAAPSGTDTSDATASASDILSGKTAYGSSGKITGTMPSNTLATPTISVSSAGKITASVSQSAGYTAGGTKSATNQLTVQSAKTWTPTTSSQTISSGTYLTGTQTISGDSNLIASNIKSGVSIFGVSGSYAGSSVPQTIELTINLNPSSTPDTAYLWVVYYGLSSSNEPTYSNKMLSRPASGGSAVSTIIKPFVDSLIIFFSSSSNAYTNIDTLKNVVLNSATSGYYLMTGAYTVGTAAGLTFPTSLTSLSTGSTASGIRNILSVKKSSSASATSPKMTITSD